MVSPAISGNDFGGGPERPSPAFRGPPAGASEEAFGPNWTDEDGCPILHLAAGAGDAESVAALLAAGAAPRARGPDGATALHRAAEALSEGCIRLLLEAGADPSAKDDFDASPVDVAALASRFALLGRPPTDIQAMLAAWAERAELERETAPAAPSRARGL